MTPKDWRESIPGLSQAKLAKQIGAPPNLISMIESGRRTASVDMAQKYIAVSDGLITLNDFPHIVAKSEKYRDFLTN